MLLYDKFIQVYAVTIQTFSNVKFSFYKLQMFFKIQIAQQFSQRTVFHIYWTFLLIAN